MKQTKKIFLFFVLLILITGCSAKQIQESESLAIFRSIAISPDGQYIAAGRDIFNIIFLYDAKSFEIVKYFRGQKEDTWGKMYAKSIDFSPNGKYLAAGGIDNIVCIWDVYSGERVLFLYDLKNPNSIAFSPDGETLAVAGPDNVVRLVKINTGEIETTLTGHDGNVLSVAFSPSKKFLLSGGTDNVLRLWDLESKIQIANYKGHTAPIERITFSPDGDKMISASKFELKQWQISTRSKPKDQFDAKHFQSQTNALSLFVNLLGLINVAHSGLAYRPVSGKINLQEPLSAEFSPDGNFLAITVPNLSLSGEYQLKIINLKSKNIVQINGQFFAVAVSPGGEYAVTAGNGLKFWDLESGKQLFSKK